MTPYKVGQCSQCQKQVMVQDTNGRWNSFKPNFRQIDMVFEDGHRMRVVVCSACADNPNFKTIMASILHEDSEALSPATAKKIKARGEPVGVQLARAKQGENLKAKGNASPAPKEIKVDKVEKEKKK